MVSEENASEEMTDEIVAAPPSLKDVPWEQWVDDGEAKFLAAFAHLVKNDKQEDSGLDSAVKGFAKAIHELILKGINGPLNPEQVTSVISRVLFWNVEIPSVIVDVLSVIDIDSNSIEVEPKKKFNILCKAISKIIPVKLFKERYEMEPLTDLDILPSKNFPSKFIKIKTRLYYKQNKFNLLREEMEGFSKLMVCLFNQRISDDGGMNVEESKNLILSLCGWFSLDPGRVLDIILDIFECNVSSHSFFIPLIKDFVKDSEMLLEVLMFRYSLYFKDGITPSSLHSIVVHFINNNMLSFDEIYKELEPSEEDIYAEIEKKSNPPEPKTISLTKKNTEEDSNEQEFESHQKFGIIEILVSNGRWDLFKTVVNECNNDYFLQQQPIAIATATFVHYLIDPLYNKYSFLGPKVPKNKLQHYQFCNLKPVNSLKEFVDIVVPILEILGPFIYHDCSLIFKIVRLLISIKTKLPELNETDSSDFNIIILKLIECSLLPALSHLESNCCVSEIIWDILKLYPTAVRYMAYSNWKEYSLKCPTVSKRKAQTCYLIRNCMKKVSKENVKPMGRIMGKISHYAPVELFEYVMYQIQMYDSLIIPIVESLKYLDNMAYDVLGYVMVEAFRNDPNKRSKHDGNVASPWFINTAIFCGSIMKKYPIDITGILKYIVEELLNKNYIELLVLKEILQKMTGIEITDEMTDDQIDALGGGECLRGEAAYFVPLRSMKRSANRLKDALIQEDLLATMSIIVAQLKYNIVYEEEQDFHLKFLGKLYDECHDTLLQYGTFISGSSTEDYNFDFPKLETLVLDYHITHECAFFLCRQFLIHKAKLKAAVTSSEKNHRMDLLQINGNIDEETNDSEMKTDCDEKKEHLNTFSDKQIKSVNSNNNVNHIDCDTLSCISSEDLDEPLEEDAWGNADEGNDAHSVNEDDSYSEIKKTATITEIYNMEVCEEAKANFEWDAEDNKTWTQHNVDDGSSETNNKILEYHDEIINSDYLEDEEDMITSANVFDIPKIFNIPPDGDSCLLEPLCQEIAEESGKNNGTDTKMDVDPKEDDTVIVLDDDVGEDKSRCDKSSNENKESKTEDQNSKSEDNSDNVEGNADLDDEDKDKMNSKGGNSSKLVNILLDWVIPSVLTIQDTTSFISEEISPYASAVFWTLTLYDIYAPVDLYDKEVSKLKAILSNQEHSKDNSCKAKKEQEKINLLIERLTYEKKRHVKHVKSVLKKLEETKNEWFAPQTHKNAKNELINVLLHSCILPRVLFSAMDAVYCAKFILTLHQLHIENFSTVLCYDRLLCDIKNLVAMCSENEASRFGRFLCAVLKDVMRFHSSQEIYNEECANTPGFITKFRSSSEQHQSDKVHYENYRHLCHKWHYKITKALLCLLDSKEYILIRNTVIVLKKILPQFPVIMKLAQCIEKKIAKIKQEEKDVRQDLHTLATSYWGHLKSRMSSMIDEGQFHLIDNYDSKDSDKESKDKEKSKKEEKADKGEKDENNKEGDKEEEEEFPLSKSDSDLPVKKSAKKDKSEDSTKEDSKGKQNDRRSARSSSRASARGKRPHSEASKKADATRLSDDSRKNTRKKHKSRSKSVEPEQNNKKDNSKKPKPKREYASPEPKKSRKKEKERKTSSKRKDHDSPEPSPDRKHKAPVKTKRS